MRILLSNVRSHIATTSDLLKIQRLELPPLPMFARLYGPWTNPPIGLYATVHVERRTRGHGITLAKKQCRLDIRKFYFYKEQ